MKAFMCLPIVVLLATFSITSYSGDSTREEHANSKHMKAFDLSEFENISVTTEVPNTGANFFGKSCTKLANKFSASLSDSFESEVEFGADYVWNVHLDHVNVLVREISIEQLECDVDQLTEAISGGMSTLSIEHILQQPGFVAQEISTTGKWRELVHELISGLLDYDVSSELPLE